MEGKTFLGLSKEDVFQIHQLYYGVNPIYKSYVYIVLKMLREFHSYNPLEKTEDEISDVAFYYIMKVIDKILDMPRKTAEDDRQVKCTFEQIPIQLSSLYDQIWIHSEEEETERIKENRILAVCHTIHLCLGFIRHYDGINNVIYEAYLFNRNFQKNHQIDTKRYSDTIHYQTDAEYLYGKELKEFMKNYRRRKRERRISWLIDVEKQENRNASIHHTNIYLKEGKKTPVVLLLEGMAKAGWFVDANGNDVRSCEKAIEQILDVVFNDPKPKNPRLFVSQKKNRDLGGIDSFFDEIKHSLLGN